MTYPTCCSNAEQQRSSDKDKAKAHETDDASDKDKAKAHETDDAGDTDILLELDGHVRPTSPVHCHSLVSVILPFLVQVSSCCRVHASNSVKRTDVPLTRVLAHRLSRRSAQSWLRVSTEAAEHPRGVRHRGCQQYDKDWLSVRRCRNGFSLMLPDTQSSRCDCEVSVGHLLLSIHRADFSLRCNFGADMFHFWESHCRSRSQVVNCAAFVGIL